jgi:hypothetical protein
MSASSLRRYAGTLAVAGPVVFTVAWFVAWAVQDQYSARREDISALAALDAEQPWIMVIGFLALGLGVVALGLGLPSVLAGGLSARVGALLVTVAGFGILVAGVARNDCSSELAACKAREDAGELSWHHHVHDLVSVPGFPRARRVSTHPCTGVRAGRNLARSAVVLDLERRSDVRAPRSLRKWGNRWLERAGATSLSGCPLHLDRRARASYAPARGPRSRRQPQQVVEST